MMILVLFALKTIIVHRVTKKHVHLTLVAHPSHPPKLHVYATQGFTEVLQTATVLVHVEIVCQTFSVMEGPIYKTVPISLQVQRKALRLTIVHALTPIGNLRLQVSPPHMNEVMYVLIAPRGIGVETGTEICVLPVVVHLYKARNKRIVNASLGIQGQTGPNAPNVSLGRIKRKKGMVCVHSAQ
jgi:hypothetical protein